MHTFRQNTSKVRISSAVFHGEVTGAQATRDSTMQQVTLLPWAGKEGGKVKELRTKDSQRSCHTVRDQ